MLKGTLLAGILAAGLVASLGPVLAQSGADPPMKMVGATKPQVVPSLIVLNSRGASLQGQTLSLTGVSSNAIIFADRPVRSAGHTLTSDLLEDWGPNESFAKDPPNATVSVFSKDASAVRDAVVVLKTPKLDGDRLTFEVQILEGDLAGADGPASVFIDIIGLPFTPLSFAGVARRSARRAAFYGAAAGAYAYAGAYGSPSFGLRRAGFIHIHLVTDDGSASMRAIEALLDHAAQVAVPWRDSGTKGGWAVIRRIQQ